MINIVSSEVNFDFKRPIKITYFKNGRYRIRQVKKQVNNLNGWVPMDADLMVNKNTGEIKAKNKSENRAQNIQSLMKTIKRIRDIVDYNFSEKKDNILFVTLTYRDNMTNVKQLYKDMDKFIKKLKYHYGQLKYIYTVEPQGRGAWHSHLVVEFLEYKEIFIDNDKEMYKLWGNGFTKTQRPKGIKSIGAYLSSYLTDIIGSDGKKKKGQRLYLYPAGLNIYRASRNIIIPKENEVVIRQEDIEKDKMLFGKGYMIISFNDELQELKEENYISYAYYEKSSIEGL